MNRLAKVNATPPDEWRRRKLRQLSSIGHIATDRIANQSRKPENLVFGTGCRLFKGKPSPEKFHRSAACTFTALVD